MSETQEIADLMSETQEIADLAEEAAAEAVEAMQSRLPGPGLPRQQYLAQFLEKVAEALAVEIVEVDSE